MYCVLELISKKYNNIYYKGCRIYMILEAINIIEDVRDMGKWSEAYFYFLLTIRKDSYY